MMIRDGQALLVRHSYKPGWYFPGGGLKKKESMETAARREAMEEVGATLGPLRLFGLYSNLKGPTSDHITVLVCNEFELNGRSDAEIAQVKVFPLDELPDDIAEGTRRRIEAFCNGRHHLEIGDW
ncbi:MAG: NUDIX domain-containing protein [Chloroflexi bacterium]|nr:NUDIX domain-containing protein [Chloroflexota bacterium]